MKIGPQGKGGDEGDGEIFLWAWGGYSMFPEVLQ